MHELKLHTSYCNSFGISIADVRATEEHQGTHILPVPRPSPTTNTVST